MKTEINVVGFVFEFELMPIVGIAAGVQKFLGRWETGILIVCLGITIYRRKSWPPRTKRG